MASLAETAAPGSARFGRQFVLAPGPVDVPSEWIARGVGALTLHRAPDLPVVEFVSAHGTGIVLGWPIFEGRLFIEGETIRYGDEDDAPLFAGLSGCFVLVLLEADGPKCYLDPCGFLPLVYAPALRIAASTTNLIPRTAATADDLELQAAFDIPRSDRWFPFGLTGRTGIRRLLPNHLLDLTDFSARRYWRADGDASPAQDAAIGETVERIAALLRTNVKAVASTGEILCQLTAGRDSRMLLAAARPFLETITFVTFRLPDWTAADDCAVAQALATRFGLRYLALDFLPPVQVDLDDWLHETGTCVAGRTLQLATTLKHIAPRTRFSLTGLAGELGRAVDWQDSDSGCDTIATLELLARMGLRLELPKEAVAAGEAWRTGLEPVASDRLLDLGMLELWIPSYAAPTFYGHRHADISISPFNDRKMIALMLSLPVAYRASQRLVTDLIDILWPELNEIAFNPEAERRHAAHMAEIARGRAARRAARRAAATN